MYSQITQFHEGAVTSYRDAKFRFEKSYLIHLLELSGGKASQAAKLAEKSRTDFYELLRKHEIKIDAFKRSQRA
jgi:two-component system response regulator GlrR